MEERERRTAAEERWPPANSHQEAADPFPAIIEKAVETLRETLLAHYEKERRSSRIPEDDLHKSCGVSASGESVIHWDSDSDVIERPDSGLARSQLVRESAPRAPGQEMIRAGSSISIGKQYITSIDDPCIASIDDPILEFPEPSDLAETNKPVSELPALESKSGFHYYTSVETVSYRRSYSKTYVRLQQKFKAISEVVKNIPYEGWFAQIVLLNILFQIWQVQYEANYNTKENMRDGFFVATCVFGGIFLIDIVYRISLERTAFFTLKTNIVDFFIVVCMAVGIIFELTDGDGTQIVALSAMRIIRVVNLLRRKRVLKFLERVPEIRLLTLCLALTLRLLLVVSILLFFILCFCGLPITQAAVSYCRNNRGHPVCHYFGSSFFKSVLTLYQAMFSGLLWGELWDALEPVDAFTKSIFLFFITFSVIVLGNMISLVFHTVGGKVFDDDKQILLEKERLSRAYFFNQLRELLSSMDINMSGALSWDEIEIALTDEEFRNNLNSMDVSSDDVAIVFNELENGTGAVGIEEFLCGCHRVKGAAKTADIVTLQLEVQNCLHYVLEVLRSIQNKEGLKIEPSAPSRKPADVHAVHRLKMSSTKSTIMHSRPSTLSEDKLGDFKELDVTNRGVTRGAGSPPSTPAPRGKAKCFIKKVEERSMTIAELIDVNDHLSLCISEDWKDMRTGVALEVEQVNLYHFAYHYLLPRTCPEGIIIELKDLEEDLYGGLDGAPIVQMKDDLVIAEGLVKKVVSGQVLKVLAIKGQFHARDDGSIVKIFHEPCGSVKKVDVPGVCSYKELVSTGPAKPLWFCSHWWGEPVHNFVLSCEGHRRYRGIEEAKATYWICAYANRQWGDELAADLGVSPEESSFARAMFLAKGVLLHLDCDAVVFTRIWCCFELFYTLSNEDKKFDITTIVSSSKGRKPRLLSDGPLPSEAPRNQMLREEKFPIDLLAKGMVSCLEEGEASQPADKMMILKCFGGGDSIQLKMANDVLHSFFAKAAWPQAVKKGLVEDFDANRPGLVCLPQKLKANEKSRNLSLCIEHCPEVTNHEIDLLAEGLPPNLVQLRLSFEGCNALTSDCVVSLCSNLPPNLQILKLDFLGCQHIGDHAMTSLAGVLPSLRLNELYLHFDRCSGISKNGITEVASAIPRSVRNLSASFRGTHVDRNFTSVKDMKRYANVH